MTGTLTATPLPADGAPAVRLDLAGLVADSVTVYRVDSTDTQSVVRAADPAELTGGGWVGFDYEAPFWQVVTYLADDGDGNTWTSAPVALDVSSPWLIHPGDPTLSLAVTVADRGDRTRTVATGVHQPLSRRSPVIITDGTRHAPAYDLMLRTLGVEADQALAALLADAETLLFQMASPDLDRSIYDWVSVGDVGEADGVSWLGSAWLQWTLPCTVTDAPAGPLVSLRAWQQVVDDFATWGQVLAAYGTWRDLIADS